MSVALDTSVQFLKGVGPRRVSAFARLGIRTVEDLLYHIPHRYLDATAVTPIAKVAVGQDVTLVGRVVSTGVMPTRRRLRIFRAVLQDDSGVIECAWPGQPYLERTIVPGQTILVSGPAKFFHGRQVVPREQVVLLDADDGSGGLDKGLVLPVYGATEGLSHRQIRKIVGDNLDAMLAVVSDHLPAGTRKALRLPQLRSVLQELHSPTSVAAARRARKRLAFDELFDLQLVVARARQLAQGVPKGPSFALQRSLTTELRQSLPFELTSDQKRATREITADMVSDRRMHRLLMGDVGTGKTVVALFSMMLALENQYQAVFMAPTELLAEQHADSIARLLAPLGIVPDLLLGRMAKTEKANVRRRLASGESRLAIGTHALIQGGTGFDRLGLVVIDEQHRFGVEQRAALVEKGAAPDVLLLSATPIPRSLALTLYGDLDISTLRRRPRNLPPVKTVIRTNRQRDKVYAFIKDQCDAGRQAYVVYPVIEESERTDLKAATSMYEQLTDRFAPLQVGLVHGRIKPDDRDRVMRRFRDGEVGVLVATTVIEVGIDVPNATVMVIEHPERFGLAQLHQLRGRVGRGAAESHCILLRPDGPSLPRLDAFRRTQDGFTIAELDLKERGMGDLAGARQSGGLALRFTDLAEDAELVNAAQKLARDFLETDPHLSLPEHAAVRGRIERRYERGIELFRVG